MTTRADASFQREVQRAVRPYRAPILSMYDVGVYTLWNPHVWRCPSHHILDFYRERVRDHHLEAGCGTGYLPEYCGREQAWERAARQGQPQLALLDYSPGSLAWSERRLRRYRPTTLKHNLFEPLPRPTRAFESVCLNYVLHCLPGGFRQKHIVIKHLKEVLAPEGIFFGTTILGHAATPGELGQRMLDFYNFIGSFHNAEDTQAELEGALAQYFRHVRCQHIGAVALFEASDQPLL